MRRITLLIIIVIVSSILVYPNSATGFNIVNESCSSTILNPANESIVKAEALSQIIAKGYHCEPLCSRINSSKALDNQNTIYGIILDETDNTPIEMAIINIHTKDSLYEVTSDSTGVFNVQLSQNSQVDSIRVRHLAYETYIGRMISESPMYLKLRPITTLLSEVVVNSDKIYRRNGKLIIDISQFNNKDQEVSLFIKQLPGVSYNPEEGVKINGKSAVVYVNGIRQHITSESLCAFLDNLPAKSLSTIELMDTNRGEYSASTEAVINFNLDKNIPLGHSLQPNLFSTIFPHGVKKVGGNIFYMTKIKRLVFYNTLSYSNEMLYKKSETSFNSGESQQFSNFGFKKGDLHTLTYQASGTYTLRSNHCINFNFFSYNDFGNNTIDWIDNLNNNIIHNNKENSDLWNVSIAYSIPTDNRKFSGNFAYSGSYGGTNLHTNYISNENHLLGTSTNCMKGWMHTLNCDVKLQFNRFNVLCGLQGDYNYVSDNNTFDLAQNQNKSIIPFHGNEAILAAYCLGNMKLNHIVNLRPGVRIEYTNYAFTANKTNSHRCYFNYFPSFIIDLFFKNYSVSTGIISSISRPKYELLIPSTRIINQNNTYIGNPNLDPSMSYELIINNTFFKYFQLNLSYARYLNLISQYYEQTNDVLIHSYRNGFDANAFNCNIIMPFEFFNQKINGQMQAYVSYTKYQERNNDGASLHEGRSSFWRHYYSLNLNYCPISRLIFSFDANLSPKYRNITISRSFNLSLDLNVSYAFLKEKNLTVGLNIERLNSRDPITKNYLGDLTYINRSINNGTNIRFSIKYVFNRGQKVTNEYNPYHPNTQRFR